MKTLKFIFPLILLLVIYSCKRNESQPSINAGSQDLLKSTALAGKVHNAGLSYIISDVLNSTSQNPRLNSGSTSLNSSFSNGYRADNLHPEVSSATIFKSAIGYMAKQPEYSHLTFNSTPELLQKLDDLRADISESGMKKQWNTLVDSKIYNLITSREKNMVNDIKQVFDEVHGQQASNQIYLVLKSKLEALRLKYSNINYQENEGELFNGIIDIALASNNYWHNLSDPSLISPANKSTEGLSKKSISALHINSETIGQSSSALIQLDCLGYLSGWGSALWDDYNSKGGVKPSGQWRRIGQGAIWGMSASSAGML